MNLLQKKKKYRRNSKCPVSYRFQVSHQPLEHSVTDSSSVAYNRPHPPVQQNGKQLDCMLDSLTAEMSRQGVTTTQKGCCSSCDKPIVGQVITALGGYLEF